MTPQEVDKMQSVQAYSPVLRDGVIHMDYDMPEGEWCRVSDAYKAIRLERLVADERVEKVQREADEKPKGRAAAAALNPTIRQLRDAVRFLREKWGWSDGDVIFAAELEAEEPQTDATKSAFDRPQDSEEQS